MRKRTGMDGWVLFQRWHGRSWLANYCCASANRGEAGEIKVDQSSPTSFLFLIWIRALIALLGQLLLGAVLFIHSAAYAQTQEPPPVEQRRYEDWFTFKYSKSYVQDPWVWGYTKEFAERFRMPEKWVEPELKGVLAVAFRMTNVGRMTCGLGGKEDNCWPPLECQLDVYYDNRIKLPWTREEIAQDFFMKGVSSREYVHPVLQNKKWLAKYAVNADPHGASEVGVENGFLIDGKYSSGGGFISYFDHEFDYGIGLIGWIGPGFCPKPIGTATLSFFDLTTRRRINKNEIKEKDASAMHRMLIPENYMRRANAVYERDNKSNKEVTDRLMRQFIDSKK